MEKSEEYLNIEETHKKFMKLCDDELNKISGDLGSLLKSLRYYENHKDDISVDLNRVSDIEYQLNDRLDNATDSVEVEISTLQSYLDRVEYMSDTYKLVKKCMNDLKGILARINHMDESLHSIKI